MAGKGQPGRKAYLDTVEWGRRFEKEFKQVLKKGAYEYSKYVLNEEERMFEETIDAFYNDLEATHGGSLWLRRPYKIPTITWNPVHVYDVRTVNYPTIGNRNRVGAMHKNGIATRRIVSYSKENKHASGLAKHWGLRVHKGHRVYYWGRTGELYRASRRYKTTFNKKKLDFRFIKIDDNDKRIICKITLKLDPNNMDQRKHRLKNYKLWNNVWLHGIHGYTEWFHDKYYNRVRDKYDNRAIVEPNDVSKFLDAKRRFYVRHAGNKTMSPVPAKLLYNKMKIFKKNEGSIGFSNFMMDNYIKPFLKNITYIK